jgi:PAS domain S-box-containing protein
MADANIPPGDPTATLAELEREIGELRARHAVAEALAQVGSWRFDLVTGRVSASAEARRIYGLVDDEWTIGQVQDIPLPEYRPMLDHALRDLVERSIPYDVEFRIRRPTDLAVRHIHSMADYDAGRRLVVGTLRDITEQRQAEEALQRELGRLDFVIRGSRLGTWSWNVRDRTAELDEQWFAQLGYAPGELQGPGFELWHRLVHPDDHPAAAAALEAYLRHDTAGFECEFRMRRKDGQWAWVLSRGSVMSRDPEGRPIEIFGTHLDITAQKRTEEELRRSESLLAHAQQIAHVGSWVMELPSGGLTWSAETMRICGVDAATFVPNYETFMALVHPDDRVAVREAYEAAVAEHRDFYDVEHRLIQPLTGQVRELHERCVFEHDASGAIVRAVGMVQDITDRKRTEAVLRRFKQMFDTANFGAVMLDTSGKVLYINERFAVDHGYASAELLGQPFVTLHPPDRLEVARGFIAQMRATGVFGPVEVMRRHKNGSDFPMLMTGCAIRGEDGQIESFAATALDIRVQKALEDQLAQARKMESVGRLAGGVAHDFNNMLGVILGFAGLALDSLAPNDPAREYLLEINTAARRSAGVAQQLLAFARRQTIAPRLLDLNDIVESSLTLLRRLIGENLVLSWRPGAALWHVVMDPSQVHQVLTNLCVNAKDAIAGVGTVSIATANVKADADFCAAHPGFVEGDYVMLSVGDTGSGMTRETLDHLFEPFFTTKDVDKGTGLGLATVYGIVTQNRGSISVESEVGRGAEFRIFLPAHDVVAPREDHETVAGPAKARAGETILIVEDEAAILRLSSVLLKMLGYTVLSATSPGEALEQSDSYNGRIDVLLSDVIMPEMNGKELADRLMHARPGLKCVFMSGYTASAIEPHGVLEPGVLFIQKPFTTKDLAAKIRQALDG